MQLKDYVKLKTWEKNYLKIKVTTRQPKTEFYWIMEDNTIKLRVKAIPEKWKANEEIIRFISIELFVKKENIEIISWAADSVKLVRISC